MPITYYNKTAGPDIIGCCGRTNINTTITGKPNITENLTDIMLVLDSSGSMADQPILDEKAAAVEFVNLLASATSGPGSQAIGGGSRIGVIDFNTTATTATLDQPLTDSVTALTAAIDAISAGGGTNAGLAFTLAMDTLLQSRQ